MPYFSPPYDDTNPSHFNLIVMVRLLTKSSSYPCRLNVLIKDATAINICSNPQLVLAICGKINPAFHTQSQMTELIHDDSVLTESCLFRAVMGGDLNILVRCRLRSLAMCWCARAAPYPKCLRFRSRAKCSANAPLSKTLRPAQASLTVKL